MPTFIAPVQATTPPDACFNFDTTSGTINYYYDNEGDIPGNPACPRDVDIPATIGGVTVSSIYDDAFYSNQLTSVTIPNSVTSIGVSAFSNNQLTQVNLMGSINNPGMDILGNGALYRTGQVFLANPGDINTMDFSKTALVPAYTTDPSNPHGYVSEALVLDISGDGQPENVGGTLINPAQITVRYVDEQGNELRPSTYTVSPKYASYLASDNPTGDVGPGSYYFAGNSYTAAAPAIGGYTTPADQTITLTPGGNTVTMVYRRAAPAAPTNPTAPPAASTETATDAGSLADTGSNLLLIAGASVLMMLFSGLCVWRLRKQQ